MTKKIITFAFCVLSFAFNSHAKEITILYTGDTHAMLYPCSCPLEPDGGVARRGSLISQLRKNNPETLVLDAGNFFAGGAMDEYTQNTEMDQERTRVNLAAMEFMQYDAAAVQDNEFNFGRNFLEGIAAKNKIALLSCNLKSAKLSPYIIKEFKDTTIGIIGVTGPAVANKAVNLEFIEPRLAVKQAVEELKKKSINLIVVLSQLERSEEEGLIKEIPGIDILISGRAHEGEKNSLKIGSTLIVRSNWQGRRLGKLSLTVKDKKISDYKVEELRLSDKIKDDPKILTILPRCFRNADCKKPGLTGTCQGPGTLRAECLFNETPKVNLLIITSKQCRVCDTEPIAKQLKALFPGLVTSYLYYPEGKASKLVKDLAIAGLPVYLLGRDVEKEKNFTALKNTTELKGDFYMLKPEFSGLSYFINRKKINGNLDLFISLYDKDIAQVLDAIKDFHPVVHFLAMEKNGSFDAAKGRLEVEENLRAVCVQKYYPAHFWNYITCRAKNINSSWWEECLGDFDANKIKVCAKDKEGAALLKENIQLNSEIQALFGPTYLMDNQESFGTQGAPRKEDFEKIFKR